MVDPLPMSVNFDTRRLEACNCSGSDGVNVPRGDGFAVRHLQERRCSRPDLQALGLEGESKFFP